MVERDERLGMLRTQAVQMRARLPAQVQQVLEALVADVRGARAVPLEQRVRRDRRPVRESLDILCADSARRCEHRLLLVRGGRNLRGADDAAVEEHGVRERPAHVDAENRHARTLHRRADSRLSLRLRRAHPRHGDRRACRLGLAVRASRPRAARGEVGDARRHARRRLGSDGPPRRARRRAARTRDTRPRALRP